jgi:cytochrome P450
MPTPVEAVTAPDPYPYYAALAAERPFHFDDALGAWVACDAAAVADVLGEPACRVRPPAEPVPAGILGTAAGDVFGALVRMTDGDLQRRLKRVVTEALGAVDADRAAALTVEAARRAVAAAPEPASRPALDALMFQVPAQVVAALCGLDQGADRRAAELTGQFVLCLPAAADPAQQAAAARAAAELLTLMGPGLDDRDDGLLGDLLRAARREDWSETAPLLANAVGFLSQTYDATAGLIGNTLLALARESRAGRPAPAGGAALTAFVREVARHDSPVHNTRRFAARDFAYGDARVAAGQSVLVLLAAANRDPAANPDPDEFRPGRDKPALFTFGSAAHQCPGERLAVAVAAAAVAEALDAGLDPAALPAAPAYRPSANVRVPVLYADPGASAPDGGRG